jgi:DNA-binding SARP family transcriptional activator
VSARGTRRYWLELLRCEAATAGHSAALARYDGYRRTLRDELGTDPGPALQAAYQRLLQGDAPVVRRGVQHEPNPLLGRADDIASVASLLSLLIESGPEINAVTCDGPD